MLRWENVSGLYFISKADWKVVWRGRENFGFGGRTGSTLLLSAGRCKPGRPKGRPRASSVFSEKERRHPGLQRTVTMTRRDRRTHRAWRAAGA